MGPKKSTKDKAEAHARYQGEAEDNSTTKKKFYTYDDLDPVKQTSMSDQNIALLVLERVKTLTIMEEKEDADMAKQVAEAMAALNREQRDQAEREVQEDRAREVTELYRKKQQAQKELRENKPKRGANRGGNMKTPRAPRAAKKVDKGKGRAVQDGNKAQLVDKDNNIPLVLNTAYKGKRRATQTTTESHSVEQDTIDAPPTKKVDTGKRRATEPTTEVQFINEVMDDAPPAKKVDKRKKKATKKTYEAEWVDADIPLAFKIPTAKTHQDYAAAPVNPQMDAFGITFSDAALERNMNNNNDDDDDFDKPVKRLRLKTTYKLVPHKKEDFFGRLAEYPELLLDLASHLTIPSLLKIYSISRDFHETVNGHQTHFLKSYARKYARESGVIFHFQFYSNYCIPDPVGRISPATGLIRSIPSMRWIQMVVHRERTVRDILACLASESHRLPKMASVSLKKMWFLMDLATSRRRAMLMHNEGYFRDADIYILYMFTIKLDMRCNDPIDGPSSSLVRMLMLGQRGLTPLCHLLKRTLFRTSLGFIRLAIMYSYRPRHLNRQFPIFDIHPAVRGRGHLEGWGAGNIHLARPDELIMMEAVRRNLGLQRHFLKMMLWGYVDAEKKEKITPSAEELYMSDDEEIHGKEDRVEGQGWEDANVKKGKLVVEEEWVTDDEGEGPGDVGEGPGNVGEGSGAVEGRSGRV